MFSWNDTYPAITQKKGDQKEGDKGGDGKFLATEGIKNSKRKGERNQKLGGNKMTKGF